MVPTTDSVLYSHLLETLAPYRPILFVGESGTAKTTIIQKYISKLPTTGYRSVPPRIAPSPPSPLLPLTPLPLLQQAQHQLLLSHDCC